MFRDLVNNMADDAPGFWRRQAITTNGFDHRA